MPMKVATYHLLMLLSLAHAIVYASQLASADRQSQVKQEQAKQQQQLLQLGRLEAPPSLQTHLVQGPGVDLVALNRRRFEFDHHHGISSADDPLTGELIEAKIASLPEQLLAILPEDLSKELLNSLAADPSLFLGAPSLDPAHFGILQLQQQQQKNPQTNLKQLLSEDPDGASIERLTKSCLTVHASSARPEQLNVTFQLFTKANPRSPYILVPQTSRQELLASSPLNPTKPIKWITHGFHTNLDKSEWMLEAKDKILAFEDANVILTDWRRGASPALAFYPKAAANAHVVAKMIVKILRRLRPEVDLGRVHLIGHSLGAHIMGFVGSAFTEEYLYQQQQLLALRRGPHDLLQALGASTHQAQLIGRITACDPALPCFGPTSSAPNSQSAGLTQVAAPHTQQARAAPPPVLANGYLPMADTRLGPVDTVLDWTPTMWTHLRQDSAVVVEVIHSNPGVMGYIDPLGDYDFYPNGLERQPGCGTGGQGAGGEPPTEELPVDYRSNLFQSTVSGAHVPGVQLLAAPVRMRRQLFGYLSSFLGGAGRASQPLTSQEQQGVSRLSSTLDRFIKPIRDFFQGYTCSHHRSVEYMLESMYYELIPQTRKLDRDFVCQMVGYRCPDYVSFKRGFCFRCQDELDCRSFTMFTHTVPVTETGYQPSLAAQFAASPQVIKAAARGRSMSQADTMLKFNLALAEQLNDTDAVKDGAGEKSKLMTNFKRVLPTFNHRMQDFKTKRKNQYYFMTRHKKDFCLHHYHLLVKYRWFRVRDSVTLDGLQLTGTLGTASIQAPLTLNKYTHQSFTLLLAEPIFLGQIETLVLAGSKIKASLVEDIEVTYMSNLDPKIRALGSARLCRAEHQRFPQELVNGGPLMAGYDNSTGPPGGNNEQAKVSLFVRCTGSMV